MLRVLAPLAALALLLPTPVYAERPPLELGPDTTVIDAPLHDDGTPDYIRALNAKLSEGVTNETNFFVDLARVIPDNDWDAEHRRLIFGVLDLQPPDPDAPRLVSFITVLRQGGVAWADMDLMHAQLADAMDGPWRRSDFPLIAEWLDANMAAINALEAAMEKPHFYVPLVRSEADRERLSIGATALPHLDAAREVRGVFAVRANRKMEEGDLPAAWQDVQHIQRLARHLARNPLRDSQLAAIYGQWVIDPIVHELAVSPHLTTEMARQMLDKWQAPATRLQPLLVYEAERWLMLDNVIRRWAASNRRDGRGNGPPAADVELMEWPDADVNQVLRAVNAIVDELVAVHAEPDAQVRSHGIMDVLIGLPGEQPFRNMHVEWLGIDDDNTADPRRASSGRFWLARLLEEWVRDLAHCAWTMERFAMQVPIDRLALALGGYRAEHGAYPATLDDLVPGWLETVPMHPYTDEPVRYRVDDDAVVIYSVGVNRTDEGSTEGETLSEGELLLRLRR